MICFICSADESGSVLTCFKTSTGRPFTRKQPYTTLLGYAILTKKVRMTFLIKLVEKVTKTDPISCVCLV